MTDAEFIKRYRIVSITSRVYTRAMLLNAATRDSMARTLKVTRAQIAAVIDDDAWLRPYSGMIPRRVTEYAVIEAYTRNQPH